MSKRMRVFAGPNGSGKSSIIRSILNTEVEGKTLDFGIYINADDIAVRLKTDGCDFSEYQIDVSKSELFKIANESGLLGHAFSLDRLKACADFTQNFLKINGDYAALVDDHPYERIAQILADYLRKKLLSEGIKFSFETVFSHVGKVDIIKEARDAGYKVYLYFVSTEHPTINVYRVKEVRVKENGHDVEEEKIIDRYYRSMNLVYKAAQYCYQAYFFDNSVDGKNHTMFAHFKVDTEGRKAWDDLEESNYPQWFKDYYSAKIGKGK